MSHFGLRAATVGAGWLMTIAPAAAQPPMSPEDYLSAAASSDQYEIQAGRLAETQGQDERIKGFARQMVEDHGRTIQDLESAARASSLPPPPKTVSGDQQRLLAALQSLKGPDFDRTYATQQVNAHTAALTTREQYAATGSDPNLRRAAQAAVPVIRRHLDMAKHLEGALGG